MMVPGRGWCPQAKTGAISFFFEGLGPWASGQKQRKGLAGKSHSDAAGVSGLFKDGRPGEGGFMPPWKDRVPRSEKAGGVAGACGWRG